VPSVNYAVASHEGVQDLPTHLLQGFPLIFSFSLLLLPLFYSIQQKGKRKTTSNKELQAKANKNIISITLLYGNPIVASRGHVNCSLSRLVAINRPGYFETILIEDGINRIITTK
jgi:hypothetical protein